MLTDFTAKDLMVQIFKDGKQVYSLPSLKEIGEYALESMAEFYPEYKRTGNPQEYKVDLSDRLFDLKKQMIKEKLNK